MRNAITIFALALSLAACGGRNQPAEDNSNKVEIVNVVDETVPAPGSDSTLPANGSDVTMPATGAAAPGVVATQDARNLVTAIKSVPEDKRRQLAALLECEEAKIPGGVKVADRPAFVQKQLEALNADPSAVAHCRAGNAPTQ